MSKETRPRGHVTQAMWTKHTHTKGWVVYQTPLLVLHARLCGLIDMNYIGGGSDFPIPLGSYCNDNLHSVKLGKK